MKQTSVFLTPSRTLMDTPAVSQGSMEVSRPLSHPWTLPSLGAYLFLGLKASFHRHSTQISGPQLFAMFLFRSHRDTATKDKSLQLAMLKASADKGYIPAQAVIKRVHESYGVPLESPHLYLISSMAHHLGHFTLFFVSRYVTRGQRRQLVRSSENRQATTNSSRRCNIDILPHVILQTWNGIPGFITWQPQDLMLP